MTSDFLCACSGLINAPLALRPGTAEADEVADRDASEPEIVDVLCLHDFVEHFCWFELDHDGVPDHDLRDVGSRVVAAVLKQEGPLPLGANPESLGSAQTEPS